MGDDEKEAIIAFLTLVLLIGSFITIFHDKLPTFVIYAIYCAIATTLLKPALEVAGFQ